MLRSGRWLLAAAWLTASSALASPSTAQPPPAPPARTEAELAAARKLFAEALRDQQEQRLDAALETFQRVRDVRDTPAVEYRIGTCLEGLGRLADATAAYDAAIHLAEGDPTAADVAAGARERNEALSKRVAHLTLTLSSHAPQDAEVRVDGKPRPAGDVVLDPGSHRVEAMARGAAPFQSDVTLSEGGRVSLTVPMDPPAPSPRPPFPPLPPAGGERGAGADGSSSATWGWISLGTGGVLVAASVTSFLLRESDIRTANRDCPGGGCVGGISAEAQAATTHARLEGPLGYALGGAGILAAGLGLYLVVSSSGRAPAMSVAPTAWYGGAGLALRGAL